jgi:hypothetical protein
MVLLRLKTTKYAKEKQSHDHDLFMNIGQEYALCIDDDRTHTHRQFSFRMRLFDIYCRLCFSSRLCT